MIVNRDVHLSLYIYTEAAVLETADAFRELVQTQVRRNGEMIDVTASGENDMIDELLNYALSLSAQQRLV